MVAWRPITSLGTSNLLYFYQETDMTATQQRILIIEDEASLRQALVTKLTAEGYLVDEASDGQEGLDKILQSPPDLILLDQLMPKMDGQTMLNKMNGSNLKKKPFVIIISNVDDHSTIDASKQQGAFDYLIKSNMTLESIVQLIKHRLPPTNLTV